MTAPFVAELRTQDESALVLGPDTERRITVRVEIPEVWDAVRIELPPQTPVHELKRRALDALQPRESEHPEQFVVKLHGFEVLDERNSIAEAGAVPGSIFLITHRRRRPIRG